MTQKQIIISAYPITERGPGYCTFALGIRKESPSRRFNIRNVADCKAALDLFAKEMETTQRPWHLMTRFDKRTGRKPNGFDKAQLQRSVNEHLAATAKN